MNDYISVNINSSFLLNAGIVGFMRFLEFCKATKGVDFIEKEQELLISKAFLKNTDIPNLYIDFAVDYLKNNIDFLDILSRKKQIDDYFALEDIPDDKIKIISEYFKRLVKKLQGGSFESGFNIIEKMDSSLQFDSKLFNLFKNEKNLHERYKYYCMLCEYLENKEVKTLLSFKELSYSYINFFFDKISFLYPKNVKELVNKCYEKSFYKNLINSFEKSKKSDKRCIECMENVSDTEHISFMNDTTDDIDKKKSPYWNCKPDATICHCCKFIYSFVPFGFSPYNRDAIFINCNSSVEVLFRINDSFRHLLNDQIDSKVCLNFNLLKYLSLDELKVMSLKISNVQVIFRNIDTNNKDKHYKISIIDKNKIEVLERCSADLKKIENKFRKDGDNFIRVYDEVFESILEGRNLYNLFFKFFREDLGNENFAYYLKNILNIELTIESMNIRRRNMKDKKYFNDEEKFFDKKYLWHAFNAGAEMRKILGGDMSNNSLRGLIYKLLNAVSSGDRFSFCDSVIRVYSGMAVKVPDSMKDIFNCSDEAFSAIASNYMLGLSIGNYKKEEIEEA